MDSKAGHEPGVRIGSIDSTLVARQDHEEIIFLLSRVSALSVVHMAGSPPARHSRILRSERRHSIFAAYANGGLWGIGNGLASTTLVTYLAKEYGATGVAVSWLLAAPAFVDSVLAWKSRESKNVLCRHFLSKCACAGDVAVGLSSRSTAQSAVVDFCIDNFLDRLPSDGVHRRSRAVVVAW